MIYAECCGLLRRTHTEHTQTRHTHRPHIAATMSQNLVELAKEFLALRGAGKNAELVAMLTEDFVQDHFKDGVVEGKAGFRKYVDANPAPTQAKMGEPKVDGSNPNVVRIEGTVRKMMMDWKVALELTFTADAKVSSLRISRR